MGLQVH